MNSTGANEPREEKELGAGIVVVEEEGCNVEGNALKEEKEVVVEGGKTDGGGTAFALGVVMEEDANELDGLEKEGGEKVLGKEEGKAEGLEGVVMGEATEESEVVDEKDEGKAGVAGAF